jgi:Asp-tRNA(Asn)/Glu-tRNA(Gln) amidotransferase A subunit family amidase
MISSLPSIPKAVEAMRRGQLTAVELVEYCLAKIQQHEEQVRAWVFVDEAGARREAERLDGLARSGSIVGALHGIPIAIKDIIDVDSWPTKAGSPLRENHVASRDSEIVSRLRSVGAIILGKTVTTQFASFDPPVTRNPWNSQHTPGGSSSGSAAAVASEMCMAAIGTQTGGSIIRPASYCGVAGLKPTMHAVSLEGVVPLAWSLDHAGPIGRSVEDLTEVFGVLHRIQKFSKETAKRHPPRLSWLKGFFWDHADTEVRRVTEQAVRKLGDLIENRDWRELPEPIEKVLVDHRRIMAVEAAEFHREFFEQSRDNYRPCIGVLLQEGLQTTAVDYAGSLKRQKQFTTQFQNALGGTILVTPSTTTTAPGLETTGDPSFNSPWSYAGVPTVTIPCGLDKNDMPCGLQLIAAKLDEQSLLAVADLCEQRLRFNPDQVSRR